MVLVFLYGGSWLVCCRFSAWLLTFKLGSWPMTLGLKVLILVARIRWNGEEVRVL